MGKDSKIGWTTHTWNPWRGCHKVSEGCKNCYMYREAARFGRDPNVVIGSSMGTFTSPRRWKKPAHVFTCSHSDFFIEEADEWRALAWDIIKETPHLTYQILTKRPENVLERLPKDWRRGWDNVWLGVSAENQIRADERVPVLLNIPARIRFVSAEPLLGPIDCRRWFFQRIATGELVHRSRRIHWVITGGESGPEPKRRGADLNWFRSICGQCIEANVPFFHKQHGGWKKIDGEWGGHELDGRYWKEMPD